MNTTYIKYNAMSWLKCLAMLLILAIVAPCDLDAAPKRKTKKKKYTTQELENMFLTFDWGGGLYTYTYDVKGDGQKNMKPGGTFNVCFQQFFYSGMGYCAGIGVSYYGAATTFSALEEVAVTDKLVHAYDKEFDNVQQPEPETFTYRTYFNTVSERQHLVQLEVPVMAMYKLKNMTEMWDFTVGAGVRLGVPLMKKYKLTDGMYETRGYFESTNVEYNDLEQHGFTTKSDKKTGKSNLNPVTCNLCLDAGFNYHWTRNKTIYFGLYFSYCITNVAKSSSSGIVSVDDQSYNGVLGSQLVDNAHLMGAGAKVQLCLDFVRVQSMFKKGSARKVNARSKRSVRSMF